jgi:hypothetical protein
MQGRTMLPEICIELAKKRDKNGTNKVRLSWQYQQR